MGDTVRLFTPGPVAVHQRVLAAMAKQVVSHRSEEFHRLLEDVEEKLRKIYGLDNGVVAILAGSGTTAVDAMLWSIASRSRTLIVVHGEFGRRMLLSLNAAGSKTTELRLDAGECPTTKDIIEALEEEHYDFLAIVHNETSTGTVTRELEDIARTAYKHGVSVLVDTVSGLGGEPFKMYKGVVAAASCSHKALAAPPGVSFVALSDEAVELVLKRRTTSVPPVLDLAKYVEFMRLRRETPFTPPVNLLYALNEALDMILEKGLDKHIREHRERATALYQRLQDVVKPVPMSEECRSSTVAAFWVENAVRIKKMLMERGFMVATGMGQYRERMIRIGLMGAISIGDVMELADSIVDIVEGLPVRRESFSREWRR